MQMTTLGRGGPAVSSMGMGTAALGRPGYLTVGHGADVGSDTEVASMRDKAHHVLDTAFDAGIRYIDTAWSYGLGERFVASWLADREIGFDDVTVGSKWGYRYTADWQVEATSHEVKDLSAQHLDHQWQQSTTILGERLDLYQVHSATHESGVLSDRGVLDRLAAIRDSGTLVGITVTGPAQRETVLRAMDVQYDGTHLFATVQATWNLLETSAGDALADASHEGIGVIVKEAVANGRLTDRGRDRLHDERWEALTVLADELSTSRDAVAIAGVLARPWVDVVLSGAATAEQVVANVAATRLTWSEHIDKRLHGFAEDPAAYWRFRGSLPWT